MFELARNGPRKQLNIVYGIGLLDHVADSIEAPCGGDALSRLKPSIPFINEKRPINHFKITQETTPLLHNTSDQVKREIRDRTGRVIVTHQLPALIGICVIGAAIGQALGARLLAITALEDCEHAQEQVVFPALSVTLSIPAKELLLRLARQFDTPTRVGMLIEQGLSSKGLDEVEVRRGVRVIVSGDPQPRVPLPYLSTSDVMQGSINALGGCISGVCAMESDLTHREAARIHDAEGRRMAMN
jgi:hypothetical protein